MLTTIDRLRSTEFYKYTTACNQYTVLKSNVIEDWVESTIQPGFQKEITRVRTHNTLHVSSRDTSAPCSPSRLSLGTALVHRSFITKNTSVCRLICVAIWCPYSTTNEGEVSALQRTKKPAGLCLSVLTLKFN